MATKKASPTTYPSELAKQFGCRVHTVAYALKRARLRPVEKFPFGNGFMKMYDRGRAEAVVANYLAERDEAVSASPEPADETTIEQPHAAAVSADTPCLQELAKHLAINDETQAEMSTALGELFKQNQQLVEQNRALLAVVNKCLAAVTQLTAELGSVPETEVGPAR